MPTDCKVCIIKTLRYGYCDNAKVFFKLEESKKLGVYLRNLVKE